MAVDVWQNLPKAQDNAETIEEAIDRKINAHEADATAHLGANESLSAHRASEVIDHLAESIVTDKIANQQLTPDKLYNDRVVYNTNFSDLAYWTQQKLAGIITYNLGELRIECNMGASNYCRINGNNLYFMPNPYTEKIVWQAFAKLEFDYISYQCYMGIGQSTSRRLGFRWNGTSLVACYKSLTGAEVTQEISGYLAYEVHNYKIETDGVGGAKFYVDDNLCAELTITENAQLGYFSQFEMKAPLLDFNILYLYQMQFYYN